MEIIPFEITIGKKEKDYWWLSLDPVIPKRLDWKCYYSLIITLNKNRDLVVQPYKIESPPPLPTNPENIYCQSFLICPSPNQLNYKFSIHEILLRKINPKRSQPFALTGLSGGKLLISTPP